MGYIKYSLLTMTFFVGLTSCSDYLEVSPDERLEVDNLKRLEAVLVGSYQNKRSYRFTHFSSDDVELAEKVFKKPLIIEDLYTWKRNIRTKDHQDSPDSFWIAFYKAISQANLVLEKSNLIETNNVEEKNKLEVLVAEAKLVRSYNHFMLVNVFSKHYDPNTAQRDLGVPYVESVEDRLIVKYKRATVEEVYDKAEKDLLEAIGVIEQHEDIFANNRYRFTSATMYAYASRFYTYRNKDVEDQDKVILYASKSLNKFGGADNMRPWHEYDTDRNGPIDIERSDVGMVQTSSSWVLNNLTYQTTLDIKSELKESNPFGTFKDSRLTPRYSRDGNIFIPRKFAVYIPSLSTSIGWSATDIFPLVEVILNKAEAHIRKNEFEQALDLLKLVGQKSYIDYDSALLTTKFLKNFYKSSTDKAALTSYLLLERRLSLMLKGFRWFDLKRYDIDVIHELVDGSTIKLSEVAPDKDYQIPMMAISDGMAPNN